MPRLLFLFPLLLPACASSWNPTWYSQPDSATPLLDQDQDGYAADEDCDDNDAAIHPGAEEEPYDGLDNDCDEASPDDDLDQDGYDLEQDCDDGDASLNPGAEERCDGVDNDCDGVTDEAQAVDAGTWHADDDGDGFGDPQDAQTACEQPAGTVEDGSDCDDGDAAVNPQATEVCNGADDDCEGSEDQDLPTQT